MRRITQGWRILTLAIIVGVALAFGTSQAVAGRSRTCFDDPPNSLGTCTSQQNCQDKCDAVWTPDPVTGVCTSEGCCLCFAA